MLKYTCFINRPKWLSKEEFYKKDYAAGQSFSLYFDRIIEELSKNIPKRKAKKIVYEREKRILGAFPDIEVDCGTTIERAAFHITANNKDEATKKLNSLTERLESFFLEQGVEQKIDLQINF